MSTALPARLPSEPPHPTAPTAPTARAVLLIDDDDAMRKLARRVLEEGGYQVTEAMGGREALAKLRAGATVQFVVTDLKMSDVSGGWLLAHLGYEFPALLARTLLMSGESGGAAAAHVAARWGCPMLAKPFGPKDLVGAIRELDAAA
jgi:DNA-binding NtrC family response regulator